MRDHAHFEGFGPPHHLAADAAQADNPQRFPAQLIAEELLLFPLAGPRGKAGLRHRTSHREHQSERVFGDGDGVAAGRIHH